MTVAVRELVQGRDYFQVPPPFDLPDAAPGNAFTGARARVYWLLRITAERGISHPAGVLRTPPCWVPRQMLVEPWSGGGEGGKRVRELRLQHGCDYEVQPVSDEGRETMYRLTRDGLSGTTNPPTRFPCLTTPAQGAAGDRGHTSVVGAAEPPSASCALSEPHAQPQPAAPPSASCRHTLSWLRCRVAESHEGVGGAGLEVVTLDYGWPHGVGASSKLIDSVRSGRLSPDRADEAYRQELLGHYRKKWLLTALGKYRHSGVFFVCPPIGDSGWSAARMLRRALVGLGADLIEEGIVDGQER